MRLAFGAAKSKAWMLGAFSAICCLSYVFGAGDVGDGSFEYLNENKIAALPFHLPARKFFVIPISVLILLGFLRDRKIPLPAPGPMRIYLLFLALMLPSFLFDAGSAVTYNLGFALMIVVVCYGSTLSLAGFRTVLSATALLLALFLSLKNYFYPPFEITLLRRYGGGVNPNSHAMYASLGLILAFLFWQSPWRRVFLFLPMAMLATVNVVMTGSRTSYLGLMAALLAVFWVRLNARKFLFASFCVLTILGFILLLLPGDLIGYMARSSQMGDRVAGTFSTPMQMFFDNFMIPYGPSSGAYAKTVYSSSLDCGYLWILLTGGLLPFILFLTFISLLAWGIFKAGIRPGSNTSADQQLLAVSAALLSYSMVFMVFEGGLRHVLGWGDFIFAMCALVFTNAAKGRILPEKPELAGGTE